MPQGQWLGIQRGGADRARGSAPPGREGGAGAEFESSPGVHRVFCTGCGAQLYSRRDAMPDMLRLRLGTLDTPVEGEPIQHIFTAHKAEWYAIPGDAPQYPEQVPA